uniref:Cyclin-dependent kinases regulatory subunit n=1 Tax=Amazona collaria TaxID=241587 RepID=A0A8B9GFY6_9PSIT
MLLAGSAAPIGVELLDSNGSGVGKWEASSGVACGEGLFCPLLLPQLIMDSSQIYYSEKYYDEQYEYRHVVLPRELSKQVPKSHLMSEEEWRRLGVQQSLGWVHYMIHAPEPHILLFRRPLAKNNQK